MREMTMTRTVKALAGLFAGVAMAALTAGDASAQQDFYRGKQITIHTSGSGSYEAYARLVAKYLPRYIPGEPTIVVKQLQGASGLKAANYIYNNAVKDGTEIAGTHGHIPTVPVFNSQGVQYDPNKLSWIGSVTKEVYIGYMWHTSPVTKFEEARTKESIVGGQAVGSMSIDIPILANAMMGTKFKIVTGYSGSNEARLALERGEINGVFGTAWTALNSAQPEWIKDKKVHIVAQFGFKRHKDMPDVPLITDFVLDPKDKKALEAFLARQETGKPFFGPPGMPADRLAILRTAFDKAVNNPELVADAIKQELDVIEPMTGQEIEKFVAEMSKTPPEYAKRIEDALAAYTAKK
jgi:tripartite-type tricarboxylate transporter receptor subunit TctC